MKTGGNLSSQVVLEREFKEIKDGHAPLDHAIEREPWENAGWLKNGESTSL